MARLTEELLQKYVDGELSPSREAMVKNLLEASSKDSLAVEEFRRIGDLLRLMDEENTASVSFEGLADKVCAEIETDRGPLGFFEKLKVRFLEFLEHRRAVWIPTLAAVGAVCLAIVLTPLFASSPLRSPGASDSGIVLHSAKTSFSGGSRIVSADFGSHTGAQYELKDRAGNTIGVVWIADE